MSTTSTDAESPRARLLRVAAHLFREKGFERTTVRDIAAGVGIQSGSIFHHFASKDDILFNVMSETIVELTSRMERELANNNDPVTRLRALILCELQAVNGETSEAMAVLVYEWRSLSSAKQEQVLKLREYYEGLWLDVLQACAAAGQIRGDTGMLRRFLTGALSWSVTWYRKDGSASLEDLADQALLLALNTQQ